LLLFLVLVLVVVLVLDLERFAPGPSGNIRSMLIQEITIIEKALKIRVTSRKTHPRRISNNFS
jgi:hypothetical protein